MATDDNEIEKTRRQDQNLATRARREAAEREQGKKLFARKALQAKRAKDDRAFRTLLKLENVSEGSGEWTRAWRFFYS
jgi:hypothetical protein